MSKNKEYAKTLMEQEGYTRPILAFKLIDEEPKGDSELIESYGDEISFLCSITAEAWDRDKPLCISNINILCGGAVYCGLGTKKLEKEAKGYEMYNLPFSLDK